MPVWLWLVLALIVLYWVLPEFALHYLHIGVVARPRVVEDCLCLTFDDGPGEASAEVLDALRDHGAKATFFVVGGRAAARPELVRRAAAEGHEIASHGARHRSAWLLTPWGTFAQLIRGRRSIEAVSGAAVRFMRPPWGHMNAAMPLAAASASQRLALWSYDPGDWRAAQDPQELARRIVDHAAPGQIYLLHDAGGDGRRHTARALEIALPKLQELGYAAVTLSELLAKEEPIGFGRQVLQAIWGVWELGFERLNRIQRIGDVRSLLRIGRVTYRGLPVTLKSGREVKPGDRVGELHFRNPQMAALGALRAMARVERTMRDLALLIEADPRYRDLEVFFGISVVFRGPRRWGFEIQDMQFTRWRRFVAGSYLRWVMSVYHPQGLERLQHRREMLEPKGIFITREEILKRFGPGAAKAARVSRPDEEG